MYNLDILYEDNHIIVCYKDSGILSQADNTDSIDMLTIIKDYIKNVLTNIIKGDILIYSFNRRKKWHLKK